jgi:hypothetical protein
MTLETKKQIALITTIFLLSSLVVLNNHVKSVDAVLPTISGGDILVALEDFDENGPTIILVDPISGQQTVFTTFSDFAVDMKVDSNEDLIIATELSILRLDPISGIETVIANADDDLLTIPTGIDLDANGDIIVLNDDGFGNGKIVKVDPITGSETLIASGFTLTESSDIAVESSGDILVLTDESLYRYDPISGIPTLFSSDVLGGTDVLIINDNGDIFTGGTDVVKINPTTGTSTLLSSGYEDVYGMGIEADGNLIVLESDLGSFIYRVDPVTGFQTLVSFDEFLIDSFSTAVVVFPTLQISPDIDEDGIFNEIDLQPTIFSNDFDDSPIGGTSDGNIIDRGTQVLTITEEPNPDGIRVNSDISGGVIPATVEFCSTMSLIVFNPGDKAIVTCSSVTVTAISGQLSITFYGTSGTQATTVLSQGNSITFNQDTFSFTTPATNTESLIIDVEGTQITVNPGETNTSKPEVSIIITSEDPLQLGVLVETSASFTDLGPSETHTAEWDWGDQTTSSGIVTENGLSGTVTGSHTYSTTGVYTVTLTITDDNEDSGTSIFQFVVIYDPNGGFVTGGGWIDSPTGAYVPDSSLVGKATFGFVSKYQNGANTPTGNTQFSFKVADLKFKSIDYDWLVVAGNNAKFKGTGTINGDGNYGFQLFGFDADIITNDPFEDDKFRIKIWDKDNGDAVVYDNNIGLSENAEPSTILGGGSIVIHNP